MIINYSRYLEMIAKIRRYRLLLKSVKFKIFNWYLVKDYLNEIIMYKS